MQDPFFFGKTVSGDAFINREREIDEIGGHLKRGQNVILYSPRRYGKTSLIKKALASLGKRHIDAFYLDLYRVTSIQDFCASYSAQIVKGMQSAPSKLFETARELLPSFKPKLVYAEPGKASIELDFGPGAAKDPATLKELFDAVDRFASSRKKRACVVFDEFQEITLVDGGQRIEREMRSAFQHHEHVAYAFLGSKNHLMSGIFQDISRPFYNFGVHYELGVIEERHWVPYLCYQFRAGGFDFNESHARAIIAITGGHPYYTQLFCSALWESSGTRRTLPTDCIEQTLIKTLQRERHAFSAIWDSLKIKERALLEAVARADGARVFSKEFLTCNNFGTPSAIQRVVTNLIEKDLIAKLPDDRFAVSDPLLRRWLVMPHNAWSE